MTAAQSVAGRGDADLVLHGGRVLTLDGESRVSTALAARDGVIVAVGGDARMLELAASGAQVIDLAGRTVIPGINDAHLHGAWLGARWPHLFFGEGHQHADTGRLVSTEPERRAALTRAWAVMSALGITSYTEPGIGPGEDEGETGCFGSAMFDTYASLAGGSEQTVRVTLLRLFGLLDGPSTLSDFEAGLDLPLPRTDPRWLAVPGVKIFADGIPPMQSAWTCLPYPDGSHGGLMTVASNEGEGEASRLRAFTRMVELAHERGLQVAVHATGDRTIDEFVSVIERLGGSDHLGRPHYVVHGDLVTPAQIRRMGAAGIGIDLQPLIAEHTKDWLSERVDRPMAEAAWPLGELLRSGASATLTSDAPIASPDWRLSIAAAAELLLSRGEQVGAREREAFLRMYTTVPAAQDGAASWKGSLEPGKVADLCVLSADPLTVPLAVLPDVEVDLTVVGGRVVYARTPTHSH